MDTEEKVMSHICDWCGHVVPDESEHMMRVILKACRHDVCYVCALEWVSEPKLTLDLEPSEMRE